MRVKQKPEKTAETSILRRAVIESADGLRIPWDEIDSLPESGFNDWHCFVPPEIKAVWNKIDPAARLAIWRMGEQASSYAPEPE